MHHTQRASLPVLYHSQNLSITLRLPTQRHPDTLPRLPGPALDSHQYKCRISSYGQQPACSVAEYLFRISSVKPDISHHRNKHTQDKTKLSLTSPIWAMLLPTVSVFSWACCDFLAGHKAHFYFLAVFICYDTTIRAIHL